MSHVAAGPEPQLTDGARRQNAVSVLFFLCAALAFLTRFCISPELMNRVMDYTNDAGAFYEKLHFGTYAIFILLPVMLFSRPIFLRGNEIGKFKALVRYSALIVILVLYLIVTGRAGASGFIIDSYLVAGAAGLVMLSLNVDLRRALGDVTVIMLIVSAVIGLFEAITQIRILPYTAVEDSFRPIGLSEHPLALGALCATAIGFVALTRWRTWVRVAAIFVLFIGCAASGARFALLLAGAEILMLLLFVPWPRLSPKHEKQAKTVVLLFTLAGGAALVAVLFAGGLLSRFSDTIFDENFMARITVYRVFEFVSLQDVFFGMNLDAVLAIVNRELNLPFIESTPVILTFLFGLPLAIFFAGLVFWMLKKLLLHAPLAAWLGTATFLLAALSNNTLSSKTPVVTIIVVLLVAYAVPRQPDEA